jgi:hypothetical protein
MNIPIFDNSQTRLSAWLITFQFLVWIVTVNVTLTAIFNAGSLHYWTPSTMASHQTAWIVFYVLLLLGTLLGSIPIILIARTLTATRAKVLARIAFVCAIVSLGFGLAYIALRFSVINFTEPTLGDSLAFKLTGVPVGIAFDLFEYLSTAVLCICLW